MTVEEKREALREYCINTECYECVLRNKGFELGVFQIDDCVFFAYGTIAEIERAYDLISQPAAAIENGGNNMEKQTITINLERYEELIKKEALYDEITKGKKTNIYLYHEVNEPLKEEK